MKVQAEETEDKMDEYLGIQFSKQDATALVMVRWARENGWSKEKFAISLQIAEARRKRSK